MKISSTIRIILYALAIVILTTIMGCFIADDMYLNEYDVIEVTEAPYVIIDKHITAQVQNIEIEWVAGSITIETDENVSDIHIEEYKSNGSDYQMVCRQAGQTLKIQFCEDSLLGIGQPSALTKDLVITVPTSWNCNTLEIDAAASDVQIIDLTINELDFDGASGNLQLDNCNIVFLDIDTASGDVEFSGVLKDLDFDAASANFYGEFYECPHRLTLDAASGNMELVLPTYAGFSCKVDAMSGSFNTDFPVVKQDDNTYVYGESDLVIEVSAMSGDVQILKGIDAPQ